MNEIRMEPVDEVVTPGCPNCAIKHLSSALALLAVLKQKPEADLDEQRSKETSVPFEARVLLAQALINLVEADEGYASHRHLAVGLLNLAEAECVRAGESGSASTARGIRLLAMSGENVVGILFGVVTKTHLWMAHQREAMRELPAFDWDAARDAGPIDRYLVECIRLIEKEYFTPSGEKGGEGTMASCKSTKAACKGGKCGGKKGGKKGCCK